MSCTTGAAVSPYKYGAKELDTRHGLNAYDFHARLHLPDIARFSCPDPKAHDYPGISPYAYCAANPVRFIDPTGEDIYWIDPYGHIVKQITDKEEIFIPVSDMSSQYINPDDTDNKLVLPEGSVKYEPNNKTASGKPYAVLKVNDSKESTKLFEFLAKNTNVEWSQIVAKKENVSHSNFLMTTHLESKEIGAIHMISANKLKGYSLLEINHSHPNNLPIPSGMGKKGGDVKFSKYVEQATGQTPTYKIYLPGLNKYITYTSSSKKADFKK